MFHHYLHSYYNKNIKKGFNKEVFFGFATTLGAFIIISFTDFALIRQISVFSIISLAAAYMQFAFLYPKIGFTRQNDLPILNIKAPIQLSYKSIFTISLIAILLSPFWLEFDRNIKNLDYNNEALQKKENFFKNHLTSSQKLAIAISANSIDELIVRAKKTKSISRGAHIPAGNLVDKFSFESKTKASDKIKNIKEELTTEAENAGFRKGYFSNAYLTDMEYPKYTMKKLKQYGIPVFKTGEKFYTFGYIDKKDLGSIKDLTYIKPISVKKLFEESMNKNINQLIILGLGTIAFIVSMLYLIAKKETLRALTYILFPLSAMLSYGILEPFNILNIFMIFIILSISIDYAIYTSSRLDADTKKAITYSLLSTFAGFGVLVFSQINALFSIGIIASIGIISIFVLLVFMKGEKNAS